MKNPCTHAGSVFRRAPILRILLLAVATLGLLTGCPSVPRSGKLETPTFSTLEIPQASGGWTTWTSQRPYEVLPTRGRVLRVWFYAPVGSSFGVALRAPNGVLTPLTQNFNTPEPPETGFFQIVSVNAALNPPLYTAHIRPPLSLPDQGNFDVLITNKSLRTDVTDSDPLIVPFAQRKIFTVSVQVMGNGHVTSNPPGIACGTSAQGRVMSPCSFEFGNGQVVSLNPASNDSNTTRFKAWAGNCDPGVQVCTLTVNGMSALGATAVFEARTAGPALPSCPIAPLLPGRRWIDIPACATGNIAGHPGITNPAVCDANGYFCCEPGPSSVNAPRCGGAGKIESAPDCRHLAPRGMLIQPGGCYELN